MPYTPISETEFNNRYQLLSGYIKANENTPLAELKDGLNNLPNGHDLKNKNLFVLNGVSKSFLHKAAVEGDLALIKFLKETGHDIDLQDAQHKTPLYDACEQLKLASVNDLLAYGANPNLGDATSTFKARRMGIEVSYQGEYVPLVAAIESTATVTSTEFAAASRTSEDFSGLTNEQATKRAAATIVQKLIAKGADVLLQTGIDNYSAFQRAIFLRKSLVVNEIADEGRVEIFRQRNRDGEVALHMVAAFREKEEKENESEEMQEEKDITDIIITHAEETKIQELLTIKELQGGNTPLHTAVICSNIDVVKAIYKSDYKFTDLKILSIQNNKGNTPLQEAVLEAWRGPKILSFLLSVAMPDDLAIVNHAGETVKQMAERLLREASSVHVLVNEVDAVTAALEEIVDASNEVELDEIDVPVEIGLLQTALDDLNNSDPLDDKLVALANEQAKALSLEIDDFLIELENYERVAKISIDEADKLAGRARRLIAEIKSLELFQPSYLDSLKNVKQEGYFAWKTKQLQLPSSFPNLESVDPNLLNPPTPMEPFYELAHSRYDDGFREYHNGDYQAAIQSLKESIQLFNPEYAKHRALAHAHCQLAYAYLDTNNNLNAQTNAVLIEDNTINARTNLEEAIKIYLPLEEYVWLEPTYQALAKTYIKDELSIASYEDLNQKKLLFFSNDQEQLEGHLALAGLYKELKERNFVSTSFSMDDLQTRESFHYHQAYKLTQGKLDNSAHVVLQREIGIANDANLGTYNIQQCVAVVAFDPVSRKVVLSHFDKASGPANFIDQLVNEFPGQAPIDLYISGGRDRVTLAATTIPSKVSDNNIDHVLKQIHLKNVEDSADGNPDNGRFKISACDVGDKPSPQAIVFDVQSQRLVHATPNLDDTSLESRVVSFLLQKNKADYVRPLNPVDFTESETERTVTFSSTEQQEIHDKTLEFTHYYTYNTESETWKQDQIFHPLKVVSNEIAKVTRQDFSQGLLTDYLTNFRNSRQGIPLHKACLSHRRKREAEACSFSWEDIDKINLEKEKPRDSEKINLDSRGLLELLKNSDTAKRKQLLQLAGSSKVSGDHERVVQKLAYYINQIKPHVQLVGRIASGTMQGQMAVDTLQALIKDDGKTVAINLGWFMGGGHAFGKLSEGLASKGESLAAAGNKLLGKSLQIGAPFLRRGTSLLIAVNFADQVKALQQGDTEALGGVISNGVNLGIDLLEAGIEVGEITGIFSGISAVTGPAGEVVGALVMLGVQIYDAVRSVARLDHLIHLSGWEKFKEGWRAFIGIAPEEYIQKMVDLIEYYKQYLAEKLEFLKSHPDIKHYVFSALEQMGKECRVVFGERSCSGGGPLFPPTCTNEKTVCEPVFGPIKDNSVDFRQKGNDFKLTRALPTSPDPSSTEFTCLPVGDDTPLPKEGAYKCVDASGLTHKNATGNRAYLDLLEGYDIAHGFENSSNIFIVKNGVKYFYGGHLSNIFILLGEEITGVLMGSRASDDLILSGFLPKVDRIEIDFTEEEMRYGNKTLRIPKIERLFGTSSKTYNVTAGCDTQVLDTQGGSTTDPDRILIPSNDCHYAMKVLLTGNVVLTNEASTGHFNYDIESGMGEASVDLPIPAGSSTHQFVFNATVADLLKLSMQRSTDDPLRQDVTFQFDQFKLDVNSILSNNTLFYFKDGVKLELGDRNPYLFHNLNQSLSTIMDHYAVVARRLNITCVLQDPQNEVAIIGHSKHEVMHNDPRAYKTHLHGNGGESLFAIDSGLAQLPFTPLGEVVIYHQQGDGHVDSLDLRRLSAQIRTDLNATAEILFVPPNASNRLGNDILLLLAVKTKRSKAVKEIMTIRVKDALIDEWYRDLHILLQVAPLKVVGSLSNLRLVPVPLEFKESHQIINLGVKDVEENTLVIITRNYEFYEFFRDGDNLRLTNTLSNDAEIVNPLTILLENFYAEPKLETLSIEFLNKTIVLKEQLAKISAAADWNAAQIKLEEDLYATAFTSLGNHTILDMQSSHHSVIETKVEVNASDTNFHEANNITRRRRAVESSAEKPTSSSAAPRSTGILQAMVNTVKNSMPPIFSSNAARNSHDKTLELADDFHDKQDRQKPIRKKASKQSKKVADETILTKPVNNSAKPSIATGKPIKKTALSKKPHKPIDDKPATNNTVRASQFFYGKKQKQIQSTCAPQKVRSNNQTFYVKQSSVKNNLAGVNFVKGIENKPGNFSHSQFLASASLADHSYRHQQQNNHHHQQPRGKSGLSSVTAPGDIQGLIHLAHLFVRIKPQVYLKPKVAKSLWKEEVDREIRNMRTSHSK